MVKILTAARNAAFWVSSFGLLAALSPVRLPAQIDMQQSVAAAQSVRASSSSPTISNSTFHQGQGPAMVPPHFAQLKLGPGFLLGLNVLDDSDFTSEFRVDEAGNINLPELGTIHVAGMTIADARDEIVKELVTHGILKNPQVELNVVEYTAPQVTVLGAVASPGVFPLLAPEGLADVLALAGDTTILAGDQIEITPPNSGSKPQTVHYSRGMDTKLLNSVVVQPGDTVHVQRAGVVYVLGGVNRPGGYVMQQNGNLSILQAIAIAGGTGVTASIKWVYIMHRNGDNTTAWFQVPYRKMTEGKVADVQLHTNDVLFVPTSRLKYTFMNTQSILSSAASSSIYAAMIY